MNKIETVFIGGPIQNAIGRAGYHGPLKNTILQTLRMLKEAGYEIVSALTEGYLEDEKVHIMDTSVSPAEACAGDYVGVTQCDAYICLWPSAEDGVAFRSDGMCVELGWATATGIPCILVRDMSAKHSDIVIGLEAVGNVQHIDFREFIQHPDGLLERLDAISAG